jgi:Xaa-Pro aminopeptidase
MLVTEYMNGEFGEFYALEPLTVVPIDKSAIVPGMMDEEALDYLNDYNAWVFESLHSYFSGEELEFMKGLCSPI